MQVVLKTWSRNPDYSGGCDYAVVDIDEDFAKLALRRINALREQKAPHSSLYEAYYWDSSAEYFSPWVNRASPPTAVQESRVELEKMLEDLEVDMREVATAPAAFRVRESQIGAVDCAQMIVREEGIAFNALRRHTDIYVTTAEISKQVLDFVRSGPSASGYPQPSN